MAQKEFKPITERLHLTELSLPGIEKKLIDSCRVIEGQIESGNWLKPDKWTPSLVKSEIHRITNSDASHFIPNRKNNSGPHYKGLYLWVTPKGEVVYIGISQNLETRIAHHVTQKNRSIATWAYMMSKQEAEGKDIRIQGSYDFIGREKFQKKILKSYRCTIFLEPNDYLLYILEAYASIYFKSFWNSFQTH